jgi:hypothetical protein
MQLTVAHVGGRPGSKDEFDALTQMYLDRCSPFARCKTEAFRTEDALIEWLGKQQGRVPAVAVMLDSCGRAMTSEAFAAWLLSILCSLSGLPAAGRRPHATGPICCCLSGQ